MNAVGQVTAWPNLIVELPATVGVPAPPVKGELGRELMTCWPVEILRGASPRMILDSIPAGRSIVGVSTRLRGKLGTKLQNARDQHCPAFTRNLGALSNDCGN